MVYWDLLIVLVLHVRFFFHSLHYSLLLVSTAPRPQETKPSSFIHRQRTSIGKGYCSAGLNNEQDLFRVTMIQCYLIYSDTKFYSDPHAVVIPNSTSDHSPHDQKSGDDKVGISPVEGGRRRRGFREATNAQ